jgi:hypothetical protein
MAAGTGGLREVGEDTGDVVVIAYEADVEA